MKIRRLISLLLLLAISFTVTYGQPDCVYLNTDWVYNQPSYELVDTFFTLNVRPNLYTLGSNIEVTFGAVKPYTLLFIQARYRGGADNTPVGSWQAENTAYPIYCGAPSNSLLDTRDNSVGSRTFQWNPPAPQLITGDIEFRATIIVNENQEETIYFGLTSPAISYTDPCDPLPCLNNGNCQIRSESLTYICRCVGGYRGQHCQFPPDNTDPCDTVTCQNGGICTGGNPICQCNAGYTGTLCEVAPDQCSGVICQNSGTCIGGFCNCINGYTGTRCEIAPDQCSGVICQNSGTCIGGFCNCINGYTGTRCEIAPDPCSGVFCLNSGTCVGGFCNCINGYTGTRCEIAPDPCSGVFCLNSGTCVGGFCNCINGYTGTRCEIAPDPCSGVFCLNSGSCVGGFCNCINGYTGTRCEIPPTNPCTGIVCLNGGTCTGGDPICACVTGWTGPNCQAIDISSPNPCNPNPCYSSGTCIRTTTNAQGYICACPDNYSGDLCETFTPGMDECSSNPCRNSGTCNVTHEGYQCQCTATFTGTNCETSISIPEPCESEPCLNMGICFNSPDLSTFICKCIPPWMGGVCNEIDSSNICDPNPCGEGECQLQDSGQSFLCTCPDGSQLVNQPCVVRACISSPCFNGGTCFNRHDIPQEDDQLHVCLCASGYTGINCETRETTTILAPSPSPPSTITPTTTIAAPPSNPCASAPCLNGGTCLFGNQGYFCLCPNTHIGKRCETEKVSPTSPPIATPTNLCKENPCMNGGICTSIAGTVLICACPDTYTGPYCEIPVSTSSPVTEPPSVCDSFPCINGGLCNPWQGGSYICLCPPSFRGTNCENPVTIPSSPTSQQPTTIITTTQVPNPCSQNPCMNSATCSPVTGTSNFECICTDSYTGMLCDIPVTTTVIPTPPPSLPSSPPPSLPSSDPCAPNPCLNRGTCQPAGNAYTCNCMDGYAGQLCETDVNECASLPCVNDGNCIDEVNGYRCECSKEFSGNNCEIIIACEDYCSNNGRCALTERTRRPICTCIDGYMGEKCNFAPCTDSTCQNGGTCSVQELGNNNFEYNCECRQAYIGPTCAQIVTCDDDPCLNGARCLNNPNDGVTCICINGFYGTYCEQDFDECSSNPCLNSGKCINHDLPDSYVCECRAGYTGTNCETDIGDDYCAPGISPCTNDNTVTCINSQEQKKALCVCRDNFKGNMCEDSVNLIVNNLDPAARSTKIQIGSISLEPWWIALICLVLFLLVAFILIVACVTFRDKRRGESLPRAASTDVIY